MFFRIINFMPRIARTIAVGYPYHITQRGNNRATVFFDDEDRQTYLNLLRKYTDKFNVAICAYCIMNNHTQPLAVPETDTGLARGIGMLYTQCLNRKFNQSGRIWQNLFLSCIVENNQYLWHVAGNSDPLLADESWLATDVRAEYTEFLRDEDEEIATFCGSDGASAETGITATGAGTSPENWEASLIFLIILILQNEKDHS